MKQTNLSTLGYDAINIYYRYSLAEIGGIDTMTYNLAYKYASKKNILFLVGEESDFNQIKRLQKVARVEIYTPKRMYRCKKLFVTYEGPPPENIKYEKVARVSHGDLFTIIEKGWKPKKFKVDEEYGVSKNTCESVKWYFGNECKLCPNPYIDEPVKPLLKLISPQRMTWEKGKERILKFAQMLTEKEIPYQWLIFCNRKEDVEQLKNPNLIWVKSRLDIKPFIKDADYLVLLSECEGSPMAPQEALMLGTPIIVTDLPCYKDLNVNEENSFLIKKDMSNLDVNKIYEKKGSFNFKWKPPQDIWGEILEDGRVEPKVIRKMKILRVKATKKCIEYMGDGIAIKEVGDVPKPDQEFEILEERADKLIHSRFGFPLIEIVGEKEAPKTTEKANKEVLNDENKSSVEKPKKAPKKREK